MHQASRSCRRGVLITVDDSASLVLSVLHQTVHSTRQLRRRPRRDRRSSCRSSGVYSHLLGRDGTACQWPSRPAAEYSCLRGLFARAPDAQELQWLTSCLSFLWRVAVSVSGPWRPWSQRVRFPAPLVITVRCRTFEFSIVSISSGVKQLLELRVFPS